MTYTLAVDLGTTATAAAVLEDGGLEPCRLGETSWTVPSIVLPRDDGRMLIGEAAALHGGVAPVRLARTGGRPLVDDPAGAGARAPHQAMGLLLAAVVDQVTESRTGRPARLALVEPAARAGIAHRPYRRVAANAAGEVVLVAAPRAAAALVDHRQPMAPGATVGVVDLGGEVSEAALVRRSATGFALVGEPCTGPGASGADVDTVVLEHIDAALDHAVSTLADPGADPSGLDRLRAACRRAKHQLLTADETVVQVSLPPITARVRLTRAELQHLVRPHVLGAMVALERTLAAAGVPADDLEAVVLVGGPARLPVAAEVAAERLGRHVVVDPAPETTAALGAALLGTPEAERPARKLVAPGVGSALGDPSPWPSRRPPTTVSGDATPDATTAGEAPEHGPDAQPEPVAVHRHLPARTTRRRRPVADRPAHHPRDGHPAEAEAGTGTGTGDPTSRSGDRATSRAAEPTSRRVVVASVTLVAVMAAVGSLLIGGADAGIDQQQVDAVETSEHPASTGAPRLSDPADPTAIGSRPPGTEVLPPSSTSTEPPATTAGHATSTEPERDDGWWAGATPRDGTGTGGTDDMDGTGGAGGTAGGSPTTGITDGTGSGTGSGRGDASGPSGTTAPPTSAPPTSTTAAPERPSATTATTDRDQPPAPPPQTTAPLITADLLGLLFR